MENTIEEIESTTSYADWYTQQWLQQQRQTQNPQIDWFGMIPKLIFLGITVLFIIKLIKAIKSERRERRAKIEAEKQAEKQAQRADEERRHQEILQAIRESGKIPDDYK